MHHRDENAGRQDYKKMECLNPRILKRAESKATHAPRSNPGTMHVHNVELPTCYHTIYVRSKSRQIEISDALNDALVEKNVSMNDLGPIVLACPDACIVQECSLCAVLKPI
jgi:hypothetical protein